VLPLRRPHGTDGLLLHLPRLRHQHRLQLTMRSRLERTWLRNRDQSWSDLDGEFCKPYLTSLDAFLRSQNRRAFYPANDDDIFRAFALTLGKVDVVILGQDPYYSAGQATGLAFAVRTGVREPSSLENIFRVLSCNGYVRPTRSDLTCWERQGVLLLNCILTVADGKPNSHRRSGSWTHFTKQALQLVAERNSHAVYCLWGARADDKRPFLIKNGVSKEKILTASHPSPRTWRDQLRGHPSFATCTHFSDVNRLLSPTKINWSCG